MQWRGKQFLYGGGFSFLNGKKYGYIYIVQLDKSYSLERWGLQPLEPPFLRHC